MAFKQIGDSSSTAPGLSARIRQRAFDAVGRFALKHMEKGLLEIGIKQAMGQGLFASSRTEDGSTVPVYRVELCDGVSKSELKKFVRSKCLGHCTSAPDLWASGNGRFEDAFFEAEKAGLVTLVRIDGNRPRS